MRGKRAKQLRKLAAQEYPAEYEKDKTLTFNNFRRWIKSLYMAGELKYHKI